MWAKVKSGFLTVTRNRWFCLAWLLFGAAYFTWYGFLKDPNEFTASMIGLDYPGLFKLWGLFTTISLALNTMYLYRKYNYTKKVGRVCLIIAACCIAITVHIPSTEEFGLQLVAHWSTALAFAAFNALAIGLCLLNKAKTSKLFMAMLILFIAMLALMIVLLLIFGKSGTIENIPLWGAYLILLIMNLYPERKTGEQHVQTSERKEEALIN